MTDPRPLSQDTRQNALDLFDATKIRRGQLRLSGLIADAGNGIRWYGKGYWITMRMTAEPLECCWMEFGPWLSRSATSPNIGQHERLQGTIGDFNGGRRTIEGTTPDKIWASLGGRRMNATHSAEI